MNYEDISKLPLMLHDLYLIWGVNPFKMMELMNKFVPVDILFNNKSFEKLIMRSNRITTDFIKLISALDINSDEAEELALVIDYIERNSLRHWYKEANI